MMLNMKDNNDDDDSSCQFEDINQILENFFVSFNRNY